MDVLAKLTQLSDLNISSIPIKNALEHITEVLTCTTQQRGLGLQGCSFGVDEWRVVGDALKGLPLLSFLHSFKWSKALIARGLSRFKLEPQSYSSSDFVRSPDFFLNRSFSTLTSLDLNNIPLHAEGAACVAEALLELSSSVILDLGSNNLGPEGMASLVPAVQGLIACKALDLVAISSDPREENSFQEPFSGLHYSRSWICLGTTSMLPARRA